VYADVVLRDVDVLSRIKLTNLLVVWYKALLVDFEGIPHVIEPPFPLVDFPSFLEFVTPLYRLPSLTPSYLVLLSLTILLVYLSITCGEI